MTAATPPRLPGFDYLQTVGAGGFAEVHLYEQHLPRRRVAVKVLTTGELDDRAVERFRDEANLMAQLSTHPSIVTIHQAGIAETGQPYLVMEYCALPGYGARFRTEQIPVDEVLAVGVQLAGAVETAHRAGILHRDIKPANILVTDYHRPALADFGIAGTLGSAQAVDAYSVPWAAPEVLGENATLRVSSDVYALGATLYSLLAGRAPFELPGVENAGGDSIEAMSARIRTDHLPPIGRADVPPAVEEALAVALSASPAARYTSALSLGRALQRVQEQLGLAVTPIDVTDDAFTRGPSFEDSRARGAAPTGSTATQPVPPPFPGGTATQPLAAAAEGAPAAAALAATQAAVPALPTATTEALPAAQEYPATQVYPPAPATTPLESTVRRPAAAVPVYTAPVAKKSVWPGIVLDAVLVVAVAAAATVYLIGG